jgi:DNA-binding MarR family transcriptional regulator
MSERPQGEQSAAYDRNVPAATPPAEIPGADLGWVLGVILRNWHEHVAEAVEELPHGMRGYQILSVVGNNQPPTQSGLARHLGIDRTVMPYIIDALVERGLIERRVDPKDRRVRRIVITDLGRKTLTRVERGVHTAEDAVFSGMDAAARDAFLRHAGDLAVSIHSAKPYLDPCLAVLDVLSGSAEEPAPAR